MIAATTEGFKNLFYKSVEFDIDPISVLAIMALHPLREKGTKYQFHSEGMTPQEPANFEICKVNTRGAIRALQGLYNGGGTKCDDIKHVWAAYLKTLILWKPEATEKDPLYKLIQYAAAGLEKIKTDTYSTKSDAICEGFDSWGKKMVTLSIGENDKTQHQIQATFEVNHELCDRIKTLWTDREIHNLNEQIQMAFDQETQSPEVYIQSVTTVTNDKFHKYRGLICNLEPVEVKPIVEYSPPAKHAMQSPVVSRKPQPQKGQNSKQKSNRGKKN